MNSKGLQLGAILFCALVAVGFYLLPKKAPAGLAKKMPMAQLDTSFSFSDFETEARNSLDSGSLAALNSWETKGDTASLKQAAEFWASVQNAGMSGYYIEKITRIAPTVENWYNAGFRYLIAARTTEKDGQKLFFTKKAISSFENVLAKDSGNLEAKANLGVCFVEGAQLLGSPPMQGVKLLLDVVAKDPNNVTALVNLGYFALQSGQLDKALERFNYLVQIKPDYLDAYIYLANVYEKMGKKDEAIKTIEILKSKTKDPEFQVQLQNYIQEIKSS